MKRIFRLGVPILLVLLPAIASAQDAPAREARLALKRTDERIELAAGLSATSDDARAETEVSAATGLQDQARAAFEQGLAAAGEARIRLFARAADLTSRARAAADRAIAVLQSTPDPDRVVAQVERSRELLERSEARVAQCGRPRARRFMRVALEMQGRAEAASRDSRYLAALQLAMGARQRALRALRLCDLEEDLREAAERAVRRTASILARARELAGAPDRPSARALLARAERVQDEARARLGAGDYQASLRLTQSARALGYRTIREAGGRL